MTTSVYLIIGGIALAFIIYMIFLKIMMNKRNQKHLDDFNSKNPRLELTEVQKRLLVFGGILFYYRGEKILGIKPENELNKYIGGLEQQWEITNSAEAKETLNELLSLKKSSEIDPLLLQPSKELSDIRKEIANGLGTDQNAVEQVKSAYA